MSFNVETFLSSNKFLSYKYKLLKPLHKFPIMMKNLFYNPNKYKHVMLPNMRHIYLKC